MAVAATGFFDGVHVGHRKVIEALVKEAHARHDESLVITFWPHPRVVLQKDARDFRLLTSLDEKVAFLKGLGVDRVEVVPFTREFSRMTAAEYLKDVVSDRFGASAVVLGYDNRIGSDQLTPESAASLARSMGLDAIVAPALDDCATGGGTLKGVRLAGTGTLRLTGVSGRLPICLAMPIVSAGWWCRANSLAAPLASLLPTCSCTILSRYFRAEVHISPKWRP